MIGAMKVGSPWSPETVRSKYCKFGCNNRVYYSLKDHIWCSDPELKIKHSCSQWHPSDKAKEDILDIILKKVSEIEFQNNKNSNLLIELRLKINSCLEKQNV